MALSKIGAQDIVLKLYQAKTGIWYDLAVKDGIDISREPNVAASLSCEVLRDAITPEDGDIVKFVLDGGHNQFLGSIRKTQKYKEWCKITAYDQIQILNKSEGYYSYENITASEVVKYVGKAAGMSMLEPPHIMDSEYLLPATVEETTWLDMIHNAIEATYNNTGKRFYLWDDCGNLCFHSQQWLAEESHIQISAGYITSYSYEEDVADIFTQVSAIGEVKRENEEEGYRKVTILKNDALEEIYGTINKNVKIGEGENAANLAKNTLKDVENRIVNFSVSGCQGDITVRGGTPVKVDFFSEDNMEYIRGWFCVQSVTHHFKSGYHDMDLKLERIKMLDDWETREPDWSYPNE